MIMPAPGDLPVPPRVSPTRAAAAARDEPETADSSADRIPAPPIVDLTAEQRSILAALGAGCVDGHAAKLVGLSDRTFARRVAELMTLFGATSRFQLGMQAARWRAL
jgi:DNA-binding NarL/FixJ family response regulator